MKLPCFSVFCAVAVSAIQVHSAPDFNPIDAGLQMPKPGDHTLRILTPTLLELVLINSKQQDATNADNWNWVNSGGDFVPPDFSSLRVLVAGKTNFVSATGFRRRPIFAPLSGWDLRIGNHLFLQLTNSISEGDPVEVINNGTLWPPGTNFSATADPLRFNPAIHVNQEGYVPLLPKKGIIGYYLGSLGELEIPTNKFSLVDAQTGATVFNGTLTPRMDIGFTYETLPYQKVSEADFSAFNTPGQYLLVVPGMGASLPFRIDEGIGMDFARTYALGLFHQRSGFDVAMPFTRFTHAADHTDPALIPTNNSAPFAFTWSTVASYANQINSDNPPQVAPPLTNPAAQLYPFVKQGSVDVSGGHFEAADYSKPTWNGAQVVHVLMFAADSLPGVGALDNLGIPESGDGISDVLQEAKWEADFLLKMQDSDGGFFYQTYPQFREYEFDVLPENGDPQVVWPKNTASTAAAVAALAQCASSPRFKEAYPQAATNYLAKAMLGWQFLTNAIAAHGFDGAYQKMLHFDDEFTHRDDLAWAACELFLATTNAQFHTQLQTWFPDPTDGATMRWGWWKMYASYGNTIRDYAFAVRSGRMQSNQLDLAYLDKCITAITNYGDDNLVWSHESAYGSSLPHQTKAVRTAGWYFSPEQAFDIVVAQQFKPNPDYVDAILMNLNYEAGCNPVNVSYITGLGWKRQREVVDQYSANDRRVLPKDGVPVSNVQEGFFLTFLYGSELNELCSPADGLENEPYAFYDRWSDFWNVTTEASTVNTIRSFATALWLAGQTSITNQPWTWTNATIHAALNPVAPGQPVNVSLTVADTNLSGAKIIWEAQDQEPTFGDLNYSFTPATAGAHWIEAEVQWLDGRRAFAMSSVTATTNAAPFLANPQRLAGGGFVFQLTAVPQATCVIQVSSNLVNWQPISTNTVPVSGTMPVTDSEAVTPANRYYRAVVN